MSELSIGKFTLENANVQSILQNAGIDSEFDIASKGIDKNNDNVISEDELVELSIVDSEDETSDVDSETKTDSKTTNDSKDDTHNEEKSKAETSLRSQLSILQDQIINYNEQISAVQSNMGTAPDYESHKSYYQEYKTLKSNKDQAYRDMRTLLIKGDTLGTNLLSSVPTYASGNNVVDTAMSFNKRSASEMKETMQKEGYLFNDGRWCGDFVRFVLTETYGKDNSPGDFLNSCSNISYVPTIAEWAEEKGVLTNDVSKVRPGDLILTIDGPISDGNWQHVEIVKSVNGDQVDTIGGNTSADDEGYNGYGVVEDDENVSLGDKWFVLLSAL